jgi:hypothetical protein
VQRTQQGVLCLSAAALGAGKGSVNHGLWVCQLVARLQQLPAEVEGMMRADVMCSPPPGLASVVQGCTISSSSSLVGSSSGSGSSAWAAAPGAGGMVSGISM